MNFDREKIRAQLAEHEGMVPWAYQDSLGYWTIGIGHLIDKRKGGRLSPAAIKFIFEEDLAEKILHLDTYLPWWRTLTPIRQQVMIDMCFQLGIDGLRGFRNTLPMIEHGDYEGASVGMLHSKWARKDSPIRAKRLSMMMAQNREVSWREAEDALA